MRVDTYFGEGSASDEPLEGAGKAQRRLVPTVEFGEGSASDEPLEGAGKAQRSLVPTIESVVF